MMRDRWIALSMGAVVFLGAGLRAQDRPMSPLGTAETQVGGHYVKVPGIVDPQYQDGRWIEITYSRPIKRGRDLWGSGADYGKTLLLGAPVWRAGANVSTRLRTEVPLVIAGKTVAPGEYSLFIDLKPEHWTLIVSNWSAQSHHDPNNQDAALGGLQVHRRQRRRPRADGASDAAGLGRRAHMGLHEHE